MRHPAVWLRFIFFLLFNDDIRYCKTAKIVAEEAPLKLIQGCTPELLQVRSYRHMQMLCRSQPALAVSAYEGILDSMEHCREKMRYQPWDCTQAQTILHDPHILQFGYRESAYLWAMSAAGAAWGVATACAQGWLPECSCGDDEMETTHYRQVKSWTWSGCSYGVHYGIATSRRLLTRNGNLKSPLRALERHNLKAGRLAVKKTLISSCKCHGVSGSCQQKTCWKRASDLSTVSGHLHIKFQRAHRIYLNDELELNRVKTSDLVYWEPTPETCLLPTERHRICNERNATRSQGDCERLCCGRGYTVRHETVPYKCDCKFEWCCKVVCNDCLQHRWISTCN